MKYSILLAALIAALGLSACEKPTVVTIPAAPVAVPGPAGPQGATGTQGNEGAQGESGKTGGDTIVIVPAPAEQ